MVGGIAIKSIFQPIRWWCPCPLQGSWTRIFKRPFHPKPFSDSISPHIPDHQHPPTIPQLRLLFRGQTRWGSSRLRWQELRQTIRKQNVKYFSFLYTEYRKVSVKSKTLQLLCTVELSCFAAGRWLINKKRQTGYNKRSATIDNLRNVIPHVALYTALKHWKNAITDVFTQNPTLFLIWNKK